MYDGRVGVQGSLGTASIAHAARENSPQDTALSNKW
jgi:hypothetical protein